MGHKSNQEWGGWPFHSMQKWSITLQHVWLNKNVQWSSLHLKYTLLHLLQISVISHLGYEGLYIAAAKGTRTMRFEVFAVVLFKGKWACIGISVLSCLLFGWVNYCAIITRLTIRSAHGAESFRFLKYAKLLQNSSRNKHSSRLKCLGCIRPRCSIVQGLNRNFNQSVESGPLYCLYFIIIYLFLYCRHSVVSSQRGRRRPVQQTGTKEKF